MLFPRTTVWEMCRTVAVGGNQNGNRQDPNHLAAAAAKPMAGPWRIVQRGSDFRNSGRIACSAPADPVWQRRPDLMPCGLAGRTPV